MRRLLLFSLLLLTACNATPVQEAVLAPVPSVQTQVVTPGLKQNFTVTGEIQASIQATIGADAKADIIQLPVRLGQVVQKGELLMVLGSDTLNTRITNAHIAYNTAVQTVDQSKVTSLASVANAQIALDTAKKTLRTTQAEIAARREQANATYESTVLSQNLSIEASETNLQNILSTTKNTVANALNTANNIFEFNDIVNDQTNVREIHIGIRNTTLRDRTYETLNGLFYRSQAIPKTYESAVELLEVAEAAFKQSIDVLNNSITSNAYTTTELSANTAAISGQLSVLQNMLSQLRAAQASVNSARQQIGTTSQIATSAKAQLDATLAQLNAQEVQASRAVEQATNALAVAKSQAEASELTAQSALNSIGNELRTTQTALNELRINAPFAGRIKSIPVTPGQEVTIGQTLLTIENADTLKIVVFIAPAEVRLLKIGSPVLINNKVQSSVTSISPSADPITQKYEVEIAVTNETLQAGEYVDVQFETTLTDSNRFFIPISSVHIESTNTFVWLVRASGSGTSLAHKQVIKIGDLQGIYTEVTEGLQRGDTIIVGGGRTLTGDAIPVTIE